jgi:hypothetical protein
MEVVLRADIPRWGMTLAADLVTRLPQISSVRIMAIRTGDSCLVHLAL